MFRRTVRFLFLLTLMTLAASFAWASGGQNLKGKTITIGSFWENWDANTFQPTGEDGERLLDWRRKIQRDQGFTMSVKQIAGWGEMLETCVTSIMAGRPAASAFDVVSDWAMAMYRQNLLYPIGDSTAINIKNATGIVGKQTPYVQDVNTTFTFGGKIYAFRPGETGVSAHDAGVYFNKRLFREAGLDPELPFNMQKDGSWNWDNFMDICKKLTRDRNNTGRIDTWALTADLSTEILDQIVYSNGANYVAKDSSGRFVNASNRPEFIESLQFARRLRTEGVMMPRPEDANWDWYWPAFHDGVVAMMIEPGWRAAQCMDMADDWGYVFFPKGPRSQNYRMPNDENLLVLPATTDPKEADAVLAAIDLWYMPVSDDWKLSQWGRYRDPRSVNETVEMIRSGRYTAFRNYILIPGFNRGDIAWEMWWFDGDPAQLVESVSANWNALIADANR